MSSAALPLSGELWDIYDKDRQLTGRLHQRGIPLAPGDYHLTVFVWKLNSQGQLMITRRCPEKDFGLMWETTAGSAVAGDDSLTAVLRENLEETGQALDPSKGVFVSTYRGSNFFADIWLFRQDFDLEKVVLQPGETCDVMYATPAQIREMAKNGTFVPYPHLETLLQLVEAETGK